MPKKTSKKDRLQKNYEKKIKELSSLYEVGKTLTSTLHLDEVLNLITQKAAKLMNASCCTLRLLNRTKEILALRSSYGINGSLFKIKNELKVGESIAGRAVKEKKPYIINDLKKEKLYKYPHLVKQKGLRSLVTVPLSQRGEIVGVLSIYNAKTGKYDKENVELLSMLASQAAIAIENARLYEQAKMGYINTIKTLSNIIDAKDNHTYGHSEQVMEHCIDIAEELGLSNKEKEILKYASLLHDIGKIGIDVGILRKPSKLTDEEWKIMIMHPVLGSGIVEQIGFLSDLAPLILRHHERYDGKGYPGRLKRNKIPLGARILAVVDAYESMVSDRPYRKALSFNKAKEELIKGSGSQFDPKIVQVFLKTLKNRKSKKKRRG